jgi:hypothetical protein
MTVAEISRTTEIPCTIALNHPLAKPEQTCAEAVARFLSSRCGRRVQIPELEGLLLNLWSEDDCDRPLVDYLESDRPLQLLLLADRQVSVSVSEEFVPYLGQRLEFRAGAVVGLERAMAI